MNALERKVMQMLEDYRSKHGHYPKYANTTIRWNNDNEYVHDTIFALFEYDGGEDDDKIFFYTTDSNGLISLCANIDFVKEDFDHPDEFYNEVDKYATDDIESLDWTYLHRGEDFCVVDVDDLFDEL